MYKIEIYSNGALLNVGFGLNIMAAIDSVQGSFLNEIIRNKNKAILRTNFFVVITKMYFDQFGRMRTKYKKGTFAYVKTYSIKVPYSNNNSLVEYLEGL